MLLFPPLQALPTRHILQQPYHRLGLQMPRVRAGEVAVSGGRLIENGLWRVAELQSELDEARVEIAKLRQEVEDCLRRIASMTEDIGEGIRVAAQLRGENEMLREQIEDDDLQALADATHADWEAGR